MKSVQSVIQMGFLTQMPIWLLAVLIFVFRVLDVSMGTIRTISIIGGMVKKK